MQVDNLSTETRNSAIAIEYATVIGEENGHFLIHAPGGVLPATRVFSCLVRPRHGDRVMISRDEHAECLILAIVHRPGNQDASLAFDGDVAIHSDSGKLSLTAGEAVHIASPGSLSMLGAQASLAADKAMINARELSASGEQASSHFSTIRIFARSVETVADRLTQKLKHSLRLVEGMEQTRAGEMLTTVRNLFSLRARQSAILAKKDMKIDAKRIHMG